jgi:hypothetical protein
MFSSIEIVGEPVRVHSAFLAGIKRMTIAGRPRRDDAR